MVAVEYRKFSDDGLQPKSSFLLRAGGGGVGEQRHTATTNEETPRNAVIASVFPL